MAVVQLAPYVRRAYPHVITKGNRTNKRWRIVIRRQGPPSDDIYAYAGANMLDASDQLTAAGRDAIMRDVSARAPNKSGVLTCIVWSDRSCTWFDSDGTPRDGFEPPEGEPVEAEEYAHVPARLETCHYVELPLGASAPYLCVTSLRRGYVEIAPGDRKALGFLDEPPREGEADPARGMIDATGHLIVPKFFRGAKVEEVRDGWDLYGEVQPSGEGVVIRNPWPEDVRKVSEQVAKCELTDEIHAAIWRAIDPERWGVVLGSIVRVA